MQKENKRKQKTNQQYRRDIFALKNKIKQQEQYLQQIKQKCSQVDIFTEESYSFHMKIKILQNDFTMVREKIFKYSEEQHSKFYELNFCVYALSRACLIVGLTPQMVFRAVDVKGIQSVKTNDLTVFFREVLRMDSSLFNSIIAELDPEQTQIVQEKRYIKLLKCFMIDTEKPELQDKQKYQLQNNELNSAVDRVCFEMLKQQCKPSSLWKVQMVNIATTAGSLKSRMKKLDSLDCIAVYCKSDPTKQGAIESEKVIRMLEKNIQNVKNFGPKDRNLKNKISLKK